MAIRSVVTRGFGNGTFNGTIPLAVTRGYAIGAPVTTRTKMPRLCRASIRVIGFSSVYTRIIGMSSTDVRTIGFNKLDSPEC